MRWDKIVARILLIFSVINVTLSASVVGRLGHLDIAGAASEKRYDSDDESGMTSSVSSKSSLGSDSTFSVPYSESELSPPHTPEHLANWEAAIGLPGPEQAPQPAPQPEPPQSPPHPNGLPTATTSPNVFFNDEVKRKAKIYVALGTVAGVSAGILYGLTKVIKSTSSRGKPAQRDLASSEVIARGAGPHPQPRKNSVSRGVANLRDKVLLSVLIRRVLESLD